MARIEVGRWRVLMTGDAEGGEERWLTRTYGGTELRADVLKVGGTTVAEDELQPGAARCRASSGGLSFGSGEGNIYGHPSSEVIRSLGARQAQVLRTDHDGSVVVRFENDVLTVEANGDRWRYFSGRGTR